MSTYVKMLEGPALCTLAIRDDFIWESKLTESQWKSSSLPVFQLILRMNEQGAYYSTDPAGFEVRENALSVKAS